eukprot:TRINITY_DN100613_c0_g1_i1.p1 TRINITY_DN100613_c0_g1~~TRINITY_DN100613_c0_g1_i1.p1  ORF type:complete len:86 (-),score=18.57 TRINITY_DN100613_c0_g1_i1:68-292(-)
MTEVVSAKEIKNEGEEQEEQEEQLNLLQVAKRYFSQDAVKKNYYFALFHLGIFSSVIFFTVKYEEFITKLFIDI